MSQLLLSVAAFAVSALGPGFLCLKRVKMSAEARLTASIGLSLLLIYMSSFLVFLLGLPPAAYGSLLLVCAAMTLIVGRDLIQFLKRPEIGLRLLGFGILAIWTLSLLALIRNYSGDNWYGDWLEHYQRCLFFLDRPDPGLVLQGDYTLPARPPLMNVLCGYFMAVVGKHYAVYQIISTLLSTLLYFPASLLARHFSKNRAPGFFVLVAFLIFNPLVIQNATYSWTKLLAVFYVLSGVYFYLQGWKQRDHRLTFVAFAGLGAGLLTHYSAGPYTVFLAGHYLLVIFPTRKAKWRELALIALTAAVILGTWFGYSIATFGSGTVTSTTSYFEAADLTPAQNVAKVVGNIRDTLIPSLLRGVEVQGFGRQLFWGPIRDAAFRLYQFNVFLALGSVGFLLWAFSLLRARGKDRKRDSERTFWFLFPIFCLIGGIAVQGERYNLGLTHITLQPLVVMGLSYLAARFGEWPLGVKCLAGVGLVVDLLFGIAIHFWFQGLTFGDARVDPGSWGITSRDLLVGSVKANWELKQENQLVYLGDLLFPYASAVQLWLGLMALATLVFFALEVAGRPAIRFGEERVLNSSPPPLPEKSRPRKRRSRR